jgi:hypothetical protein
MVILNMTLLPCGKITRLAGKCSTEDHWVNQKNLQTHITNILQIFFSGESLLHILIMCDTLVHTRIARLVLQQYPRLAVDKIEGEEYLGFYPITKLRCLRKNVSFMT